MKNLLLTKTAVAAGCGLLVITLVSQPKDVFAGDREWATVGKILTGVVGAGLVYEIMDGNNHYTVTHYNYGHVYPYYGRHYGRYYSRPYYGRYHAPRRGYRSNIHYRPYDRSRYYCYR